MTGLGRRAKYGLIETDRGDTMIFHLGMSGRWRIDPADIGKHDHLLVSTAGHQLSLNDPRRFGFVDLLETERLATYPAFAAMGPEPLGPDLTARYLADALAGRAAPIKAMLLDQRIIAGLGNIYVCEALHRAKLSPRAPAHLLTARQANRLAREIVATLNEAVEAGGSTLKDFSGADGAPGYFQHNFKVYDREGAACGHRARRSC